MAEPQSGLFDPVTWLLVLLALLIGSAPAWLITLKSVIYFGIAASGMEAYLRERKLPPWAVGLGTAIFVLCPRLDKLKDQSALWPTAWAGWLMLAAHRCFEDPSPRRGVWLGLAVSITVLSGYPPMVFRLGLLLTPLVALVLWRRVRAERDQRAYLIRLARALAVTSLVVVGLCAAQVQATLSVLPSTERAALSLGEVFATRVAPRHALGILGVVPETSALMIYGGLASSIGIALALVFRRGAEVVLLFALGAFGFMLACGHRLPVLPALAELPGFRSFRIPAHYLVLTSVATAVLGAVGIGALARLERRRLAPVVVLAGLGFVLSLLVAPELGGVDVLLSGAVVASIVGIVVWDGRARALAGWGLVGLTAAQMFVAGRPIAELLRPHPSPEREQLLLGFMEDPEVYRVADFEWAKNRMGPRMGVRDLLGHRPALTDRRYRMLYDRAHKVGTSTARDECRGCGLPQAGASDAHPIRRLATAPSLRVRGRGSLAPGLLGLGGASGRGPPAGTRGARARRAAGGLGGARRSARDGGGPGHRGGGAARGTGDPRILRQPTGLRGRGARRRCARDQRELRSRLVRHGRR